MSALQGIDGLDDVWVSADQRSARVARRKLSEDEPRDLETKLGLALYEVFHLRRAEPIPVHARMVRDRRFEERLIAAVPHDEIRLPTVVLRKDTARGRALVDRAGVRVWVPEDRLVRVGDAAVELRARPEHPAVSPGFLMVQGSNTAMTAGPLLRTYVHLGDADGAEAVWGSALRALEGTGVAYRAKIASVPWLYPRSDAFTIYLPQGSWHATGLIAGAVDGMAPLAPDVSAFCRRLVDGVAVAWEPADRRPGRQSLSFGEHRASVLASAMLDSAREGADWRDAVPEAARAAAVDPAAPWRNLDSPDLDLGPGAVAPGPGAARSAGAQAVVAGR